MPFLFVIFSNVPRHINFFFFRGTFPCYSIFLLLFLLIIFPNVPRHIYFFFFRGTFSCYSIILWLIFLAFYVKRTQKFTLFHILGYFVLLQKLYVVFYCFIFPIPYPKIFYFCYFGVHHHNIPLFTHLLWLKLSLFNSCVAFFSIFFISYATTFEPNKNCCGCFTFPAKKASHTFQYEKLS